MKSKLILIFLFGLFVLFLPNLVEAACPLGCTLPSETVDCYWYREGNCCERIGLTGNVTQIEPESRWCATECEDASGRKCKCDAFFPGSDGAVCTARDRYLSWVTCYDCSATGKWDYSGSQCVECNGKLEKRILGNTTSVGDSCNDDFPAGNSKCESACGADTACDEITDGGQCTVGQYCQALGRNCQSGDKCSGCACVSGAKPDLIIIDIWPDGSTIKYTIKNQGNESAGQSRSYLYVDGSYKTYELAPSLSAGESSASRSFSYTWTCSGISDTIKVCADGAYVVDESNEDNNCREETWNCPLPDLIISADSYSPTSPVVGNSMTFSGTVKNQGAASAGATSYTRLRIDIGNNDSYDVIPSTRSTGNLAAGGTETETWSNIWTAEEGTHKYEICADITNTVAEFDESNNCFIRTFTVGPEVCTRYNPGVSISSSQSGSPGIQKSYTVIVINYDTAVCGNSTFNLAISSCPSYWTCSLSSNSITISPDGSAGSVYLYVTPPNDATAGEYTISVRATNSGATSYYGTASTNYVIGCDCTGWTNQSCGYSGCSCPFYKRGQTRTCTPSGCDITCQCVCDESCCSGWTNQGCGLGSCSSIQMYQTRDCGDCPYLESQCVSDSSCETVGIDPPQVTTDDADNITQTSATLYGTLNNMGGASSVIVWFQYKKNTDTTWIKACEETKNSIGSFSPCNLTGLSSNTTYYFQAFAKNGGSW